MALTTCVPERRRTSRKLLISALFSLNRLVLLVVICLIRKELPMDCLDKIEDQFTSLEECNDNLFHISDTESPGVRIYYP